MRFARAEDEDAAQHLQAMGGLICAIARVTLPTLADDRRETVIALAALALSAAHRRDARTYRDFWLSFCDELISVCPNRVLATVAGHALTPLACGNGAASSVEEPDWAHFIAEWTRFLAGASGRDYQLAEHALESLHARYFLVRRNDGPDGGDTAT